MADNNLISRTRTFALDVIVLVKKLNRDITSDTTGRQLLRVAKLASPELIERLYIEARELTSIFCASGKTAKRNRG